MIKEEPYNQRLVKIVHAYNSTSFQQHDVLNLTIHNQATRKRSPSEITRKSRAHMPFRKNTLHTLKQSMSHIMNASYKQIRTNKHRRRSDKDRRNMSTSALAGEDSPLFYPLFVSMIATVMKHKFSYKSWDITLNDNSCLE